MGTAGAPTGRHALPHLGRRCGNSGERATCAQIRTVRTSESGAALDLDREAYTCTDRVQITMVAPDLAGGAPAKGPCRASVGTSIGRLSDYALAEREPGSGVF